MLLIENIPKTTFRAKVTVRFATDKPGVFKEGDFTAEFKRIDQDKVDEMLDDEWAQSAVLDEVLVSVEGIGRSPSEPLPPEEALQLVKTHPECVGATVRAFFQSTAPERQKGRTSRRRRNGG